LHGSLISFVSSKTSTSTGSSMEILPQITNNLHGFFTALSSSGTDQYGPIDFFLLYGVSLRLKRLAGLTWRTTLPGNWLSFPSYFCCSLMDLVSIGMHTG